MQNSLKVEDLFVSVEGKKVVQGIGCLTIDPGEVHAIMGPNGSGKSSLALGLMGHPAYKTTGKITLSGKNLLSLKPDQRVKLGLFLSFQNPPPISGISLGQLTWVSYQNITGDKKTDVRDFYAKVKEQAIALGLKEEILDRFVNEDFSGGEKKKAEMLLLLNISPKFVIFDEIDSGLDVDTLKQIAKIINDLIKKDIGIILITHNQKMLKFIKPDFVHIFKEGRIVKSGSFKLAREIEEKGYEKI